uniref:FCP1 homology domain-containing protein n=1 Tax=Araucaria cunninghamii TaxID=56994 RepID=A0A0D6QVJ7_ARACU
MAAAEMDDSQISGHEKQQPPTPSPREEVCAKVWATCAHWLALVVQVVAAFIQNATSVGRLFTLLGLQSLVCASVPSFQPLIPDKQQQQQHQHHRALLPPCSAQDADKFTVVLDLDETLVCAYESSSLPPFIHNQATHAGIKWFELQCISVDKEGEGKQKVNHVTVYERPGLQEFLLRASEFAELVLFTAGLEGYARPLVDKIDPENRISARLYRPATVTTKYRDHVKDLSLLARDLRRTVIIDNNPFSFLLQPVNGIPCVPFTGAHPDDQQLLRVLLPLLKQLATQNDVRPLLYEKFHMPAWFQKRGIPACDWPS